MAKFITVTSGKGGVGKTTTSINLGAAFNYFGRNVTVVDANLTTPNVGLHLGVPVVPISLHDVLKKKNHISEAVYQHPAGFKIVPASISIEDLKNTDPAELENVLKELHNTSDLVLIDCAAGLGREALSAISVADELLVVTNPELPAVTDALKTIKVAEELGKPLIGVILTRTKKDNLDLSVKNIEAILDKPILGIIPEDRAVKAALVKKNTVLHCYPRSKASIGYKKLAATLLGQKYEEKLEKEAKKHPFYKLLKRLRLRGFRRR